MEKNLPKDEFVFIIGHKFNRLVRKNPQPT